MSQLEGFARYALYWAPPAGSGLEDFGAAWLGRDAAGRPSARMAVELPLPLPQITAKAARYGFHATLKAPFRLAEGRRAGDLDRALVETAATTAPAEGPALVPVLFGGFVALRPKGPCPFIDTLVLDLVERLDGWRAPLDEAELRRRRAPGLTPLQEEALQRYGYPYAGAAFGFHVTLSGRLSPEHGASVVAGVRPLVMPHLPARFRLDEIALFGDPGQGRPFRLLKRYPLRGQEETPP
ncbi:MAG: DUF1045 domain-containing protein [Pseudomonadota bacterium]